MIFETQSKIYNEEKISIVIEVLRDKDNPQIKLLEIKTVNNNTNYNISNVTYFLKILENNKLILSDFFYVENDVLEIQIFSENSNSLNISGKRQYEHNAIISSHELPINISGPLLLDDISYEFNFELRTIYDSTNWVFSLDDFHTKVMI
jgi:predicted transcriptional regulator